MTTTFPPEAGGGNPLAQLEALLGREEAALAHLEHLLWDEHSLLFDADPRRLLGKLLEIEEGLSRIEQCDTARKRLAAALESNTTAADAGGSPVPAIWAFRQRLLGIIARVAALNEANGQLAAGMSRVTGSTLTWLSQQDHLNGSDSAGAFTRTLTERKDARLEVQA